MLVLPPTILVNPLSAPINASAARKGSEGGLFNIKSIEPFSAFLSRETSWWFLGDLGSLTPHHHLKYFASFTEGSQIDKEKTPQQRGVSKRDPWRHFSARLIDVCHPPPTPPPFLPWQRVCKFHILISPSHVAAHPSHKSTKSGKICKIWWRLLPTFSPAVADGRLREFLTIFFLLKKS